MTDQPSYNELVLFAERMMKERDLANKQLAALRWQVEHEGCAASALGDVHAADDEGEAMSTEKAIIEEIEAARLEEP